MVLSTISPNRQNHSFVIPCNESYAPNIPMKLLLLRSPTTSLLLNIIYQLLSNLAFMLPFYTVNYFVLQTKSSLNFCGGTCGLGRGTSPNKISISVKGTHFLSSHLSGSLESFSFAQPLNVHAPKILYSLSPGNLIYLPWYQVLAKC